MRPRLRTAIAEGSVLAVIVIVGFCLWYIWHPPVWALLVGAVVVGIAVSWYFNRPRLSPAARAEQDAIRALWSLARRLPRKGMLHDSVSGHLVGADRRFGMLTLFVADRPPPKDGSDDLDAVGTWYMLSSFGRPMPPPLLRRQGPLVEGGADSMSWSQAGELLRFNDATGAMNVTPDELAELLLKLQRALENR